MEKDEQPQFAARVGKLSPLIKLKDRTIAWSTVPYIKSVSDGERSPKIFISHPTTSNKEEEIDCTSVITPDEIKARGYILAIQGENYTYFVDPAAVQSIAPAAMRSTIINFKENQKGIYPEQKDLGILTQQWEAALSQKAAGRSGASTSQSQG